MKAAREFVAGMAEQVSMPEVYVSIRELLRDPDTTIDDFVEVVQRDSMLSVRVMRMARSQYFGFPRPSDTLSQAISLIGLMQLHDLMLGCLCMRTFAAIPEQVLNLRAFWRYCVQCGIAARTIGEYSRTDGHPVFFTLGLLHEIGHAALFLKAPEASLGALETSQAERREVAEIERESLGFDYGEIGAELMRLWHLPPVYRQAAAYHLDPAAAEAEYRPAVEVIGLAHGLCQNPGVGRHAAEIERAIRDVPGFRQLPPQIDELVAAEIAAHTDFVLDLLWPQGSPDPRLQPGAPGHA